MCRPARILAVPSRPQFARAPQPIKEHRQLLPGLPARQGWTAPMIEPVELGNIDAVVRPLIKGAGEIARRQFRTSLAAEDKGGPHGYDPVTEADRATERYLCDRLSACFPGHQITGEEDGITGTAGRVAG